MHPATSFHPVGRKQWYPIRKEYGVPWRPPGCLQQRTCFVCQSSLSVPVLPEQKQDLISELSLSWDKTTRMRSVWCTVRINGAFLPSEAIIIMTSVTFPSFLTQCVSGPWSDKAERSARIKTITLCWVCFHSGKQLYFRMFMGISRTLTRDELSWLI